MTKEPEDGEFDSNNNTAGRMAATLYSLHRSIAEWQKRRGCLARIYSDPQGKISDSLLIRRANEALSRYAVRADVGRLQDGRALIRVVIEDTTRLPKT